MASWVKEEEEGQTKAKARKYNGTHTFIYLGLKRW